MKACLALVLHAHLPFVRHPEHERSLEEYWLYEAVTECYLPLLRIFGGWLRDRLPVRLTLTLTPTLCSMFADELLQSRYLEYLERQLALAEAEVLRTSWLEEHKVALHYHEVLLSRKTDFLELHCDLVSGFRSLSEAGVLELITSSATHAVLPLLANHAPSVRAQLLAARQAHEQWFGKAPQGVWLPECAYSPEIEPHIAGAGFTWFTLDTHGLMHAEPKARYGTFAPLVTPHGLAAFGRDYPTARQVWSRHEGYPGDPRYRDFYRDIGFDVDWDYLQTYVPTSGARTFTGFKYYAVTGSPGQKRLYDRTSALEAARGHASHFVQSIVDRARETAEIIGRAPIFVCPYDAELFGHWWYEGPEFLDFMVREICSRADAPTVTSPVEYLRCFSTHQASSPASSSWGQEGYWRMWLSYENEWVLRELSVAEEQMTSLADRIQNPDALQERALKQAGRELLLAQASDWPFIMRTGTSPEYARGRARGHLDNFHAIAREIGSPAINAGVLAKLEERNRIFPDLEWKWWRRR